MKITNFTENDLKIMHTVLDITKATKDDLKKIDLLSNLDIEDIFEEN
jgi:hypothetical protein